MMQNMYIVYRGFENKPKPKYNVKPCRKEYDKGKKDRVNKLP
jgi:hypothetical protein